MCQDVHCVDPEGRLYFLHLHTTKIYDLYKVHVLARHPMSYLGPKMRGRPRIISKTIIYVHDVPQQSLMYTAWSMGWSLFQGIVCTAS